MIPCWWSFRPPLRKDMMEGDFFIGAALATTLTKVALKYIHLSPDKKRQNVSAPCWVSEGSCPLLVAFLRLLLFVHLLFSSLDFSFWRKNCPVVVCSNCVCDNACTHVYVFGYVLFITENMHVCVCVCVCYSVCVCVGGGGLQCACCVCVWTYWMCTHLWFFECTVSPFS